VLGFLTAAAFYAGFETGVTSLNQVRMRIRADRGEASARRLGELLGDLPGLWVTLLCGSSLAVDGACFAFVLLLVSLAAPEPDFIGALVMTPVIFVFGEVLPRNLFRLRPEALVYPLSRPAAASKILFHPLVWLLRGASAAVGRVGPGTAGKSLFSRRRFDTVFSEGAKEGVVSPLVKDIALNIMKMGKTYLRQVMVPLPKAATLRRGDTEEALRDLARRTGFSRFPVLGEDDRVCGVLNIFDVAAGAGDGADLESLWQKPVEFHVDFPVDDALFILQKRERQMGIIVRADGTAAGIVTVKDLVEEVVGAIEAW
jgi:CBS domain containing-hemolysin-like protein